MVKSTLPFSIICSELLPSDSKYKAFLLYFCSMGLLFHKKRSRTNYILQINYYFNAQVTRIKRTCTGIIILTALSDVSCLFNFLLFPLWHAVYFSLIILLNIILLPVELLYNFFWSFWLNLLKNPIISHVSSYN